MPKGMRVLWDHRTLRAERTADNLRMGTTSLRLRVIVILKDRNAVMPSKFPFPAARPRAVFSCAGARCGA